MAKEDEFALYIHWPFCLSKCPYCDFNSHVRETIDEERWRDALLRELDDVAAQALGRTVASIFFGGGTPSLMAPATVAALLDRIAERWALVPDIEITLEANPTSVEVARLAEIRSAGVNRVSLGVQALDDTALRFLGRGHNADEALDAVRTAGALFDRYSFDLIYGRPEQTVADWTRELQHALDHVRDHVSVYQLTLEPGTPFHALWRRGKLAPLDETAAAALFEATQNGLETAGLPSYEVSNHATPGAESLHNLIYWRYGEYAGIGPGAHGRMTFDGAKFATQRIRNPEAWLAQVEARGSGSERPELLDANTQFAEMMLMGLRLTEGVPESRIKRYSEYGIEAAFDPDRFGSLIRNDLLEWEDGWLRVTAAGRTRLDAVVAHLLN